MKHIGMYCGVCAAIASAAALAAQDSPYGVCAHVSRDEFDGRVLTYEMARHAGIGWVRTDFDLARAFRAKGEKPDFSRFDAVVDDAAEQGLMVLPIFAVPPAWARPVEQHLDEWGKCVFETVRHFGDRLPVIEIWNEENIQAFWKPKPDVAAYVKVLKAAAAAARAANPKVKIAFGGTSGVPIGFFREAYRLGAKDSFDIMNVHPYTHPSAPEGRVDASIEELRGLMAEFGDAGKPVWITELGYPTHLVTVGNARLLAAALKVARPELRTWRVVYAPSVSNEVKPDDAVEMALRAVLPSGSTVETLVPADVVKRLGRGGVDAVVYPFTEDYPSETFPAVREFVRNGGVLVDFGGMPMWKPMRSAAGGPVARDGAANEARDRKELRIDVDAWWMHARNLPEAMKVHPAKAARDAGYTCDPAGVTAERFFRPDFLSPGDRFIPLLEGVSTNGVRGVAAAVYRFGSDYRGAVVVSGLIGKGLQGTSSEARQAVMLSRSLGIAAGEGIEKFFWYEFRSPEQDLFYSEHNFGLVHRTFVPKAAYSAYWMFALMRPKGSVESARPWRSESRIDYFPQWRRPDGRRVGMFWTLGGKSKRELEFDSEKVLFYDHLGRPLAAAELAPHVYAVTVSGEPVYFSGGELLSSETIRDDEAAAKTSEH